MLRNAREAALLFWEHLQLPVDLHKMAPQADKSGMRTAIKFADSPAKAKTYNTNFTVTILMTF
jgi:hypothetical protein